MKFGLHSCESGFAEVGEFGATALVAHHHPKRHEL